MNDREMLELEKRLNELLCQYREEPHHSAISIAMQHLRALDPSRTSLKEFLKCESVLPTTLIQLIDAAKSEGSRLPEEGGGDRHKTTGAQVGLLDLIYQCLINDGFTGMQVSEIICRICRISWTEPCVMRILQMSFYFIRYDLDANVLLRLLSLVIESFVAEDGSLDLVARPVVIQATELLLKSITSTVDDHVQGPRVCMFDFIHNTIVTKKNYFASYVLLIIIKHPHVDKLPGFTQFITSDLFEIALEVLRSRRLDDSMPIYEAVLKVERSFCHAVRQELDAFYSRLDGVESELLLKFISCLLNVREEIPESISTMLCGMASSVDIYDRGSKKMIKLLEDIVVSTRQRVGLARRLMEVILPKFSPGHVIDAGEKDGCPESLLRVCLRHCSENDLRDVFEAGLRRCNICILTSICVELKDYMGSSWHIYFDAAKEHDFSFLSEFTRDQTIAFVAGLPDGNLLGMKVFESGHKVLGNADNTDVLRQLLGKVTDHQVLLAILLKFSTQNAQKRMPPALLELLKGFFELNSEHMADLFLFLEKAIRIVDPRDSWDQIFGILMMGDSLCREKMQIMLYIEQKHLCELEERHIQMALNLLDQIMHWSIADNEAMLNTIFIYKELGRLALTREYSVWKDLMNFGVRMVQEKEHAVSEIVLKHLFDLLRIGISRMVEEDISFMSRTVMFKLYAIREELKLISILREVLQFVSDYSLGIHTIDLISFLSSVICDPSFVPSSASSNQSRPAILALALECLRTVCNGYKVNFGGNNTRVILKQRGRAMNCRADTPEDKDPKHLGFFGMDSSKSEYIRFCESPDNPTSNEIKNEHPSGLQTVNETLINSRVFPAVCISDQPERDVHRAVVSALVTEFTHILQNCDLEQYPIISGVLQMIPCFYFSSSEISALSKYLRKFVVLSDPYRTEAIDCFVKTCGSSNGSAHCLKILSSWLSKESKETALTLMDKISDRISKNPEDDLIDGLVNFIEYSMQFSGSDEFLEPVLNVISKSRPRIRDAEVFDRLYVFSHRFIIEQLNIPHTAKRESAILNYLDFFYSLLQEFRDEKYLRLLISIIHSNRHYLGLRLRSYEILFENYSFSDVLLKDELRTMIHDYPRRSLREGFGISNFLTAEVIFCLRQVCILKNIDMINSLKEELVDLLTVRNFEIINLVRKLLKIQILGG